MGAAQWTLAKVAPMVAPGAREVVVAAPVVARAVEVRAAWMRVVITRRQVEREGLIRALITRILGRTEQPRCAVVASI
jgi:hypothetical protein